MGEPDQQGANSERPSTQVDMALLESVRMNNLAVAMESNRSLTRGARRLENGPASQGDDHQRNATLE